MKVKPSDLSKNAAATLIALSLAVLPSAMPASAQTESAPAQNNTESNGVVLDTTPLQESKEDNNHWGALGLLGILGLANLFRKDEPKRYRDPMGE
ncbi:MULTISPECIES: WGxxGxxG family protein [unclassified Microcoleus]|uniref:WGxxGxxG family protein n=1 Tax=unclassified Microcoleus TaxID=2642155 RepID=UPI002FD393C3